MNSNIRKVWLTLPFRQLTVQKPAKKQPGFVDSKILDCVESVLKMEFRYQIEDHVDFVCSELYL